MSKNLKNCKNEIQKKKQLQVRNEFLYYNKSSGKYQFPIIYKQEIDVDKIEFLSYEDTKLHDRKNKNKTIHFYTYDWLFENVFNNPEKELKKLSQYYCLLSPNFNMYSDMPLARQIECCFKNRWCGAYWQSKGLKVIPTVNWNGENSFDWCFDGIEEGSIVAVSTFHQENNEMNFMKGYNKMLEIIKPSLVICYDEPFEAMKGNIKKFLPKVYEFTKNLPPSEQIRFQQEKRLRNVSGLNPKDFKYIKYEDPNVKNIAVKCSICGKKAFQDRFGNGKCPHCGWKFSKNEQEIEKECGISYPMLVTPTTAREQYRQGKPFKATFNEFVNGLYFYSEMSFDYNNETYSVFLSSTENSKNKSECYVIFCCNDFEQRYNSRDDFETNAHIDGVLLKDLWEKVSQPSFMC